MIKTKALSIQYPKETIPMGSVDRIQYLGDIQPIKSLHSATHWLLEVVAPKNTDGFRLHIYPATKYGLIPNFEKPMFVSPIFSFAESQQQLAYFVSKAQNDLLFQDCYELKKKMVISLFKKRRLVVFTKEKANV